MTVVFCTDRRMLGALHVAAYSVLVNLSDQQSEVVLHVLSADLTESDVELLQQTLRTADRPFTLIHQVIDESLFAGFPQLQESLATYYRLLIPELVDTDRYLYLDVDILCQTDLSDLMTMDLEGCPIALVPEAPLQACADWKVSKYLGKDALGWYFNAGVLLVDRQLWQGMGLTTKSLTFIEHHQPDYHDQSALNALLHDQIMPLPKRYNIRTNDRGSWRQLGDRSQREGMVLHFIDYPKPWSPGGRWIHPWGKQWWSWLRKTRCTSQLVRKTREPWNLRKVTGPKYRKQLKDRILFSLYARGWIKRVKGM